MPFTFKHSAKYGLVVSVVASVCMYLILSFIGVDMTYDKPGYIYACIQVGLTIGTLTFIFLWFDHLAKVADNKKTRPKRH